MYEKIGIMSSVWALTVHDTHEGQNIGRNVILVSDIYSIATIWLALPKHAYQFVESAIYTAVVLKLKFKYRFSCGISY